MQLIFAFIISFLFAYFLTPATIKWARKMRLTTDSRRHPAHTHTGIIPRAGGLPIYISILLVTVYVIPLHKSIVSVLVGGLVLIVTGLLDDKYDLSPYLRFFLNFIAAGVAIAGGLGIPYISNPFGSPIPLIEPQIIFNIFGSIHTIWLIADIAAIIWLMALMNLVNWSKGVDGQLPGYVSVAALVLAITAGRFSGHDIPATDTQLFALIVAGAFAGFLPWNFYPQRIMPGYGGGSLAGYLLGILSILSFGKVGALAIILAVPILDGIYTIIRRILHHKNPFRGDDRHLHHLLLRAGWGRRRIALFYMCTTAILGCCILFLERVLVKVIFAGVIYLSLAVWIYRLSKGRS